MLVETENGVASSAWRDEGIYGFVFLHKTVVDVTDRRRYAPYSIESYRRLQRELRVCKLLNYCKTLSTSRTETNFIRRSEELRQHLVNNKIPADATFQLFLGNGIAEQHGVSTASNCESVFLMKTYPKHAEPSLIKDYDSLQKLLKCYGLTYEIDVINSCMTLAMERTEEDVTRKLKGAQQRIAAKSPKWTAEYVIRDYNTFQQFRAKTEEFIPKSKEFLQLMASNIRADAAHNLFKWKLAKSCIVKIRHQSSGLCSNSRINTDAFSQSLKKRLQSLAVGSGIEEKCTTCHMIIRDESYFTACHIIIQNETVVIVGRDNEVDMVRPVVEACIEYSCTGDESNLATDDDDHEAAARKLELLSV